MRDVALPEELPFRNKHRQMSAVDYDFPLRLFPTEAKRNYEYFK